MSDNETTLRNAGLQIGALNKQGKDRLEALSDRDVEDLVAILKVVTTDHTCLEFRSDDGGFQRRSVEE